MSVSVNRAQVRRKNKLETSKLSRAYRTRPKHGQPCVSAHSNHVPADIVGYLLAVRAAGDVLNGVGGWNLSKRLIVPVNNSAGGQGGSVPAISTAVSRTQADGRRPERGNV